MFATLRTLFAFRLHPKITSRDILTKTQPVVDIVQAQKPTRKTCSTLDVSYNESCYKLLAIQKWQQLTILVFDIFNNDYDVSTAHHKANLPVLVDYGKRLSYVRVASPELRERINIHVANQHNYNG
ncbi:hypothetical protein V2W45_1515107 [Cenococcum geophilum]